GLGRRWAAVAWALFLMPRHQPGLLIYACDPALALVVAGGAVLVARPGRPFLAGCLLGLAALFRQDFGAYGAAAGVVAASCVSRRCLARLVLGILATAGLGYGLVALAAGPRLVYENLLLYPSRVMPYRKL